jgi:hypothetical protein
MRYGLTFTLLLLTSGLTLMSTGTLRADDAASARAGCNDRLTGIEQRLGDADLVARKQAQIRQIIDGARTIDQLDDSERCSDLADQLDRLLKIF